MKIAVRAGYQVQWDAQARCIVASRYGWVVAQGTDILIHFLEWQMAVEAAIGVAEAYADQDRKDLKEMGIEA